MRTVCLVMIVRNEEQVIQRCLESVIPYISSWIISDTGSNDRTCEIIRERLRHIPGELSRDAWQDFSHNRNLGLERARGKADYLLLIDADMVLNIADGNFRASLDHDAYWIPFTGKTDYSILRLVKANLEWRYQGVVHEAIFCANPVEPGRLPGVSITHYEDGANRNDKFEREIRVLTADLERDPTNSRTVFYLAQSYRDIGQFQRALEFYEKRLGMGGWIEETWYSLYQVACMQARVNCDPRVTAFTYLQAYQFRPSRLEPILPLVQFYNAHKLHHLAYLFARLWTETPYPSDILFIERPVYEYLLQFEYVICCHHTGRADEAKRVTEVLEREAKIPADLLQTLKSLITVNKTSA